MGPGTCNGAVSVQEDVSVVHLTVVFPERVLVTEAVVPTSGQIPFEDMVRFTLYVVGRPVDDGAMGAVEYVKSGLGGLPPSTTE